MSFTSSLFVPRWSDVYMSGVARAIDNGGDMLAAVALSLVLVQRGFGGVAVSALLLAAAVPPMLLASISGRIADRLDSRHILVVVGLAQVGICVALAYATSIVAIVGLVAALATGMAFTSPTFSALTPAMVGRDNLAKAAGIMQSANMIGSLLAPIAGGLLVGAFGAHIPLLIDAGTCLAIPAAGLLLRTRRRGGVANSEPAEAAGSAATSGPAWSIWRDDLIRPLVILFAAVVAALTAVNVVDVFFVRHTLHSSTTFYGVLSALWLGGMLIGTALVARMKPDDARSARLLFALLGGTGVTIALAGLVPHALWMVPLWVLGGITNGGENVLTGVLIGRRAPSATRGHAFATFGGVMNAATTIGLGAGGLLLSIASPREIVFGTGVAGLLALIPFTAPLLRAARRERATVTPTADTTAAVPAGI